MTVNAYILLSVEPAKNRAVFEQLKNIPGAVVDDLLGPYDMVVNLEAATPEDLPALLRDNISRDSPDQTNFPGNSSFWDTVKYNPAFQGRQMRPDSLKFPVFI